MTALASSPCIGVCQLRETSSGEQVCRGCQRTLSEIASWRSMSEQQKRQVLERVNQQNTETTTTGD